MDEAITVWMPPAGIDRGSGGDLRSCDRQTPFHPDSTERRDLCAPGGQLAESRPTQIDGSACVSGRTSGRVGRHYAWLRVGRLVSDFCAGVRRGRSGLAHGPEAERTLREPSFWRARAPIAICGPTARMERSEPLAGASRRPRTVPDIDPQAGVGGRSMGGISGQVVGVVGAVGVVRLGCRGGLRWFPGPARGSSPPRFRAWTRSCP